MATGVLTSTWMPALALEASNELNPQAPCFSNTWLLLPSRFLVYGSQVSPQVGLLHRATADGTQDKHGRGRGQTQRTDGSFEGATLLAQATAGPQW